MKTTAAFIFVVLLAMCRGAEKLSTFSTLDGQTYTNAEITELTPRGAVLHSDSGVMIVPYAQLPKALQARYGYDSAALTAVLADGIDGTYTYDEGINAFAGEIIDFKGGQFTHHTFNDAVNTRGPIGGKFRIDGNWLFLLHKDVFGPARILAVIDGRLAIFLPSDYKQWKDSGQRKPDNEPLYRKPPGK